MEPRDAKRAGNPEDPERADEWLRRHLGPTTGQVARVVRGAMAAGKEVPAPARRGWAQPAAVVAALALLAAGLVFLATDRAAIPGDVLHRQLAVETAPTITNVSGVVELRLHPVLAAGPARCGVAVFNSDGLVAAEVTNGGIRYVLVGGDT
jgi:hypothetical protein